MFDLFIDAFVVLAFTMLACLLSQRVAIFNLAVQAMVLNSSLAFAAAASHFHSFVAGLGAALLIGSATGALFALSVVALKLDAIVGGIAINFLSYGVATVIMQEMHETNTVSVSDTLAGHSMAVRLVFGVLLCAIWLAAWYILTNTPLAAEITAVGEKAETARLYDVPVKRIQAAMCLLGGLLGAFGGAYDCIRNGSFNITQWRVGEEFVALAIVAAAGGKLLRAFLPGLAYAGLRIAVKKSSIAGMLPTGVGDAVPWLTVIVIVCILGVWRARKEPTELPTADSKPPEAGEVKAGAS